MEQNVVKVNEKNFIEEILILQGAQVIKNFVSVVDSEKPPLYD